MKIASIEKISEVLPHSNADKLELIKILGYQCVAQKGLYKKGDIVVYVQPDSILPEEEWAESYRQYAPSRIKCIKLRGEFSEGIIIDPKTLPPLQNTDANNLIVGENVANVLGIMHYEPPTPQDLSAKGLLPYGIGKTDEERWENIVDRLPFGEKVDISLKIDGESCSFYFTKDGYFGILGRTLEYKPDLHNNYTRHNHNWKIDQKLAEYVRKHQKSICIRGESYGQGIQKNNNNPHSKLPLSWAMFSVYLIDERRYARKGDEFYFISVAQELGLPMVSIVESDVFLTEELIKKYSQELEKINGLPFEGVVVNHGPYEKEMMTETPEGPVSYIKKFPAGSFKIINKSFDSKK
jgi:RNA ligase (TIGR02306 family)